MDITLYLLYITPDDRPEGTYTHHMLYTSHVILITHITPSHTHNLMTHTTHITCYTHHILHTSHSLLTSHITQHTHHTHHPLPLTSPHQRRYRVSQDPSSEDWRDWMRVCPLLENDHHTHSHCRETHTYHHTLTHAHTHTYTHAHTHTHTHT